MDNDVAAPRKVAYVPKKMDQALRSSSVFEPLQTIKEDFYLDYNVVLWF